MGALAPWTDLKREMERLFDRCPTGRFDFGPKWDEFLAVGEWAPSLDLSETKEALVVKVEVPGMDAGDIQISLQENLLTVKGEKKQEKEEKDERYHRVERAYGAFTRTVRLPVAVDASKVTASFKNGLLTVNLPKTPTSKGTTIPIKAG